MKGSPLDHRTLHEQVTETVRKMIMDGRLPEGQRINEVELAAELGVSRTPLRETLRVLSTEGMVELIPRRGAFVPVVSLDEAMDMLEVMAVLEGLCARLVVERCSRRDMQRLHNLHERLERTAAQLEVDQYFRYNEQFHGLLQDAARNALLSETLVVVRRKVRRFRFQTLRVPGRLRDSIAEHRGLLQALKERAPDEAERLMRAHLLSQRDALGRLGQTLMAGPGPEGEDMDTF